MIDPYEVMVRYYDAENADLVEDLPAFLLLADRFGGPVLDVGCGTGRVTFALAQQDHDVAGVELSTAMLERAQKRAKHAAVPGGRIDWLQADALTMSLGRRFGLALLTYNTFMHFLEQDDQLALLKNLFDHLEPGGGLAIDLPNPVEIMLGEAEAGLVLERTFADIETGDLVMQQSLMDVDPVTQIMDITWVYDRVAGDGTLSRLLAPVRLRYTTSAEMILLLKLAGFEAVELYGDYDFSPYDRDCSRLFVVAVKSET